MRELTVILLVSVMLMYFILCAQFESFLQPLIVLLEIPVDTFFALLALMIFGQTLNLMSAIGIIVTCGIVVNDSILKLDAINELRKGRHASDRGNTYSGPTPSARHNHDLLDHRLRHAPRAFYVRYGL